MAGSTHGVLSSPIKGGHRGPAGHAPTEGSGHRILERPQHWVATPARSGVGVAQRGEALGMPGSRPATLSCTFPAGRFPSPPGHVFLARSGPSSILIAIITCNGVGWRPLCGGPEQHTPLRGPAWGAWRLGTRGSQRLPDMVSISVHERALSASDFGYAGENMWRKRGVRAPKTQHEKV
jgi:hypothetical protein